MTPAIGESNTVRAVMSAQTKNISAKIHTTPAAFSPATARANTRSVPVVDSLIGS